uniref:Small ribosomal subunit protein bS6c n=1 Tax=Boldia erythrosiphon TaxID=74908 RepID=A0A1Y9TM00_9RHOD|nr:30S ribosomal protein S6 [Boldia erythrosiphon]ARO90672.1 30S ribosomal protein S6 [Boldia erythrosiphon]
MQTKNKDNHIKFSKYETIYILNPEEKEIYLISLEMINRYQNFLRNKGAKNIFTQNRGRRHLTYSIKKYNDGIFLQLAYEGNGGLIQSIERNMKFNEKIIRYLTIRQ